MASNNELKKRALELAEALGITVQPQGNNAELSKLVADLEAQLEAKASEESTAPPEVGGAVVRSGASETPPAEKQDEPAEPEAAEESPPAPSEPKSSREAERARERDRLAAAKRAHAVADGSARYVVADGKSITSSRGILRGRDNPGDTPDHVAVEDFMRRKSSDPAAARERLEQLIRKGFVVEG